MRFLLVSSAALLAVAAGPVLAEPVPDNPDSVLAAFKKLSATRSSVHGFDHLYAAYLESRRAGVTEQAFRDNNKALRVADGMIGVDAMATDGEALVRSLRALGATHVRAVGPLVSAQRAGECHWVSLAADRRHCAYARPVMAKTNALPPTSSFARAWSVCVAQTARDEAGVDGSGITVGTLSDSFACHPPALVPGAPNSSQERGHLE